MSSPGSDDVERAAAAAPGPPPAEPQPAPVEPVERRAEPVDVTLEPSSAPGLVVKVTAGLEAPERCNQGFTVAAAAVAAGASVRLWLTGEASWLAVPGRAEQLVLPHAAPLDQLLGVVLDSGQVTVCSQCAARRSLTEADLLPGVTIQGAASFVDAVLRPDMQALVY